MGAIVIVSLIIGFVTITNYSKQDTSTKVYDLSQELGVESNQVLEYGLVNPEGTTSTNTMSLDQLIHDFTTKYSSYVSDSKVKLIFLFGNKNELRLLTYNELSGSFSVGESQINVQGGSSVQNVTDQIKEDKIKVIIDGVEHTFDLQQGQNFYYVISQENADGSRNVATSNQK